MCGIAGYIKNKLEGGQSDKGRLKNMLMAISHRGPDDEGMECMEDGRFIAGFGHQRLSILDLSKQGHQPMFDSSANYMIVYNGEIYNFHDIKKNLIQKGYTFNSKTDTEVVLYAYMEYGKKCVNLFNGIFSFAIWDGAKKELFAARDKIGVKPFIYAEVENGIVFGSEIKAVIEYNEELREGINYAGLNYYLTNGFIPSPHTIYKKIKKLPPAHHLIFSDGKINIERYWDLEPNIQSGMDFFDLKEGLKKTISNAVKRQMISDVPVGAFLSGGFDSSSVAGLAAGMSPNPINTFSVGFKDASYNELDYARLVAGKYQTNHHEEIIDPNPHDFFQSMLDNIDEPFADTSAIPTYLISEIASQKVKVVLSGDGGDELFAGYDWYKADLLMEKLEKARWLSYPVLNLLKSLPVHERKKSILNILRRFSKGIDFTKDMRTMRWHAFFSEKEKRELLNPEIFKNLKNDDLQFSDYMNDNFKGEHLDKDLYFDFRYYLPEDILTKVDKMSMANSIEARVPLLDQEVVEFSAKIPAKMKMNSGGGSKIIFKEAMKDILPEQIFNRTSKQGFSIPFKNWINKELKGMVDDFIEQADTRFFNKGYIKKIYQEHQTNKIDNSHKIRALIILQNWLNANVS